MARTKYSHAFFVGCFNGELKPEQLDASNWVQEIISPNGERPRYEYDRGYNGLCTMYYKSHLDAMIEAEGTDRPDFLNSVHHYIHEIKDPDGKEVEITLSLLKGKNRDIPYNYTFRLCRLHLHFFPCHIVLFSIEIDDTGNELDDLTAAHGYLMRWDTASFNNSQLAKLMMPLMAYLITEKASRLTKDGNKLKIFQTIEVEDSLLTKDLLYELGTSIPVGCVSKGNRPDMKPAEDYYNQLLSENIVSTFDNWKGLALVDSFTILGKENSFNRNDCNFLYFPLIYLRCIFEKTFCFSRNNAYREDKSDDRLASDIEQMEQYYFYDNISYNFQPSLLYKIIANGLNIKEEREDLARQIKERTQKKMKDQKDKEEKRFNQILSWATIFVVFSVTWDLCSMMKDAFNQCRWNQETNARSFLAIGLVIVLILLFKIFKAELNDFFSRFRHHSCTNNQQEARLINITDKVREHLKPHFQQGVPGSKFYCQSPEGLLDDARRFFPEVFNNAKPDADGRYRISLTFPYEVGVSNVVSIDDLTDEEIERIEMIDRQGKIVRSVKTNRIIPTHECQIILSSDWHIITMFPGEMAPPLPASPDIHDDYWDHHVFIETDNQ